MKPLDALKKPLRHLVHEFGAVIVTKMVAEGYEDPEALRAALDTWRDRRQQQWLSTDYVTPRKAFLTDA